MFINEETRKKYDGCLKRYTTAMKNGMPDRIPIRLLLQEIAGRYCGYTNQQLACDYNLQFDATRKMGMDFNCDAVMLNAIWSWYGLGKAASWKYLAVPGVDVGMEFTSQFWEPSEENAFLREDEYDEFIDDPTHFLLTKWISRACTRVGEPGAPVTYEHNLALINGASAYTNYMGSFGKYADKLKYEAGIVGANSGMIKAPLDVFADKLRGYVNTCIDVIERPDDVRRACEAMMPYLLKNALDGADPDKNVPITCWAHRGCVPFFSPETFDKIYWPTFKPLLEELIKRGHQILFYAEGNWEYHYKSFLELPEGGIVYHLDRGDIGKVKRDLKDRFAVSGGVPYELLRFGTKDEIKCFLKNLFTEIASEGGYILDCSALMMDDLNLENIRTMVDYTLEHGVYSRSFAHVEPKEKDTVQYKGFSIPEDIHRPGVCLPWEEEKKSYKHLEGDVELVKKVWEDTDSKAYNYIWTTLTW